MNNDNDVSVDGYQLGGGLEKMIGDRLSFKLEYRYLNFDRDVLPFSGVSDPDQSIFLSSRSHQFLFGLNGHF